MRLSADQLAAVLGGTGNLPVSVIDPKECTASNPSGKRIYTQSMGPDRSGPSIEQKVNAAYDKAMAPWQALNSLAGPWASLAGATTLRPK
jgi:hypothetical protein